MMRILFFTALITILLSGCSSVETKQNASSEYSALQSFAWVTPPEYKLESATLGSALMNEKIHEAVVSTLWDRGFRETQPQMADFLVTYSTELVLEESQDSVDPSMGLLGGGTLTQDVTNMDAVSSGTVTKKVGVLNILIINPKNGKLIWGGKLGQKLDAENFSAKGISEAVAAILAEFPPEQ